MDAKGTTQISLSPCRDETPQQAASGSPPSFLIVVEGGIPGTMFQMESTVTSIGRGTENTIQFNDTTISRLHASFSVDQNGNVGVTDLESKNGTFVNGQRVAPHRPVWLRNGDRVRIGNSIVLKFAILDPLDERFQREIFDRIVRDSLTGLFNRGYFLEQVSPLENRSAQAGLGLAVILLDIDHFKMINDTYGHDAGDLVLKEVARLLRDSPRPDDLVARYGGEEFIFAIPVGISELAFDRAERLRRQISELRVPIQDGELSVTASMGIAFRHPTRSRPSLSLITDADEALYQAKRNGRNRTILRGDDSSPFVPLLGAYDSSSSQTGQHQSIR